MNHAVAKCALLALALSLCTGCFRVSSETRALRDAALNNGVNGADEKIELALGRLTFAAANFGLGFIESSEIPDEARVILGSVKGAEVSVYEFEKRSGDLSKILAAADKALERRGCERLVGVLEDETLVAVYVPKRMRTPRDIKFNVLVIEDRNLVCVAARGDAQTIIDLALGKAREHLPDRTVALK